jgi:hypothetical protein
MFISLILSELLEELSEAELQEFTPHSNIKPLLIRKAVLIKIYKSNSIFLGKIKWYQMFPNVVIINVAG